MKRAERFGDASYAENASGQLRSVLILLWRNYKAGRKTTGEEIHAIGSSAKQRARDIRLGITTELLAKEGKMLWLDPTELHEGKYWMYPVTWEVWVKERNARDAYELKRCAGIQQDLFKKKAA